MEFKAKTEAELIEDSLAPAGEYDFQVLSAVEKISKKGNPMMEIKLGLFRDGTLKNHVFDYLLESFPKKLRHFCAAIGMIRSYEEGKLEAARCVGQVGRAKIIIRKDDPSYPPSNAVADYIAADASKPAPKPVPVPAAATKTEEKDDLPF